MASHDVPAVLECARLAADETGKRASFRTRAPAADRRIEKPDAPLGRQSFGSFRFDRITGGMVDDDPISAEFAEYRAIGEQLVQICVVSKTQAQDVHTYGLAYLTKWMAGPALDAGILEQVLEEWTPPYPGLSLYYPRHRHLSASMRPFVSFLREQEAASR